MDHQILCRICLNNCNLCSNIYAGHSSNDNPIYEVINYVYDLDISIDDGLPEYVCQDCLGVIKGFEKYKKNAHKARNELMLLKEKNYMYIKVEKEDFVDSIVAQVSESEQIQESQVISKSKINFCDNSSSLILPENSNCGSVNYMECLKGKNSVYGRLMTELEGDSSNSQGIIANNHEDNYTVLKKGEEIKDNEREFSDVGINGKFADVGVIQEDNVSCHHCGEERRTLGELKEHIDSAHLSTYLDEEREDSNLECKEKRQKCSFCGKTFQCKLSLAKHLRIHTGETLFKCYECDYLAVNKWHLKSHIQRHSVEKPFKCNVCEYNSSYKSDLKKHMMTHLAEKPFKCNVCKFGTSLKSVLKRHMYLHSEERPFKCNICEYSSACESTLKIHILAHTGEKPFKCRICGYSSSYKSDLKRHSFIHTGEKPFKCNICEFSCSYRSVLKTHILTHTGEKPFKCNICEHSSLRASDLKLHILTHSEDKPLKCHICEYSSSRPSALKKHILAHAGEKPFKCNMCDFSSLYNSNLKKHILNHSKKA